MPAVSYWNFNDVFIAILLFGAAFAFVLGVGQFLERDRNRGHEILGALLCVLALPQLNLAAEYLGLFVAYPHLNFIQPPMNVIIGPLVFAYFHRILVPEYQPRAQLPLIFGALIIAYAGTLPFIWLALKLGADLWTARNEYLFLMNLYFATLQVFILAYLVLTLRDFWIVLRHRPRPLSPIYKLTIAFVGLGLVIMALLIFNQLSRVNWMLKSAFIMLAGFPVLLFWAGVRFPRYFQQMHQAVARGRYERSRLGGVDTPAIVARLRELMELEHLYADEDLSLAGLAAEVRITPHQLSEILNQHLNQSFKHFVNDYRVAAARRLLLEDRERSVLSIAGAVGFASKSSFNAEFARIVGNSPSVFRKASPPPSL